MDQGHFLNDILGLEDEFYAEGYALGTHDGTKAGFNEGSVFAVEKGFEKFQAMGRLYGKGIIWAKRLPNQSEVLHTTARLAVDDTQNGASMKTSDPDIKPIPPQEIPKLANNPRLEKHITTFLSLVDPLTLSLENNEEAVADFDDRLKRAVAKARVIEKMLRESSEHASQSAPGSSNIEDISSLPANISNAKSSQDSQSIIEI